MGSKKKNKKFFNRRYLLLILGIILLYLFINTSCTTIHKDDDIVEVAITSIDPVVEEIIEVPQYDSVIISEVMLQNDSLLQADDGSFPGWVEIANVGETAVNIADWKMNFYLDDESKITLPSFPGIVIQPGAYRLLVFTPTASTISYPGIRITTTLDSAAKAVELENELGESENFFAINQSLEKPISEPTDRNSSYIRDPSFLPAIRKSDKPTPALSNDSVIPVPQFVLNSGFYEEPILDFLNRKPIEDGWEIRFTINDGLEFSDEDHLIGKRIWIYPTNVSGTLFTDPVTLDRTSVIKARYYSPTGASSEEVVRTYFVGESTDLPIFSVTMDPADLWDEEIGLYSIGDDPEYPNFKEKWLRLASIEFFHNDTEQAPVISDQYVMRNYGNSSRAFKQKSMALYAKEPGSTDRISNEFFFEGSAEDITDFYSIVLRNSGGDNIRTFIRDGLMTGLATEYNIDKQDYQPAVVFLNGQYWGILNIREKINEYYIEDHYNYDSNKIDLVEGSYRHSIIANEGSPDSYMEIFNMYENIDASFDVMYQMYEDMFDIDNMIDYFIFQSFYNNTDWPWSNAKFWRPQGEEGKWRWLMYDTDAGFDTVQYWTKLLERVSGTPDFNMLGYLFSEQYNHDVFSMTYKALLKNSSFYSRFFDRYEELLNTVLTTDNLLMNIDAYAADIETEMNRHITRWNDTDQYGEAGWSRTMEEWMEEIQVLKDFAAARPSFMRQHIEQFKLEHPTTVPERIRGGAFEKDIEAWNLAWSPKAVEQEIIPDDTGFIGYLKILEEKEKYYHSVAFVQDKIYIIKGESLTFSFDVKANRQMKEGEDVKVLLFDVETNEEIFSYVFQAELEWETKSVTFAFEGPTTPNCRLQFRVGKLSLGQELYLDNVFMGEEEL